MKNQPTAIKSWALSRFLPSTFIAEVLPALVLLLSIQTSHAGSATWLASPSTGDWNTAANWTPMTVPNGPADTATFATSNVTGVSLSSPSGAEVDSIVFSSGGSAFTITVPNTGTTLVIVGAGITNNSGITQNFVAGSNGSTLFGGIEFDNSATAGNNTSFLVPGDTENGAILFIDSATASTGTFTINGGSGVQPPSGSLTFDFTSTAASAILIAQPGTGGIGGDILFRRDSTGGTARVELFGTGTSSGILDITGHNAPGLTIGSIEGSGVVRLGANKLTVGANNLSTVFSGVIQDGGGSGGSLTKIGKGKLTLSNASTYTGGTTLTKGTLLVRNSTGSGTGTGAVQVNKGMLGGTGIITGAVTVGTGTSSGAILLAGNNATSPGILTINNTLTFNSISTYECVLKRSTVKASKATALGVTINSGATFTFLDTGTGTLTVGTVFTVINNTSANPIFGTFSNLANGSVFTSNGNNFQASYTGGDGNDLTLTVVP